MRLFSILLLVVTACRFDEGEYGDRLCTGDQDCPRPDQSCIRMTCTQRTCDEALDCGSGFAYSCELGGCVAVTCAAADCPDGFACTTDGYCEASFSVSSVASTSHTSIAVTFDAPPDEDSATTLGNYVVDGLALSGTPSLSGSTVTLTTSPQSATTYNLTVSSVTRASDRAPLKTGSGSFTGRTAYNVASAISTSNTTVRVTFDAAPDPATGAVLTNYSIPGLVLSGTPVIAGNDVTLTTEPQQAMSYAVTVSNVRRASDGEGLRTNLANFVGRTDFNIVSATAPSSGVIDIVFDAEPNSVQATMLSSYTVSGLTLTGAPVLTGTTVRLTTAPQQATSYTLNVSGVTRALDAEPLTVASANFAGVAPFHVMGAASISSTKVTVTFDGPPNMAEATMLSNYSIPGLTLGGTPSLVGNTVTLETSPQAAQSYTVSVANVTRASTPAEPLSTTTAMFTGRAPFNIVSAVATTSQQIKVTFDAAPDPAQATMLSNYTIPGLTLSGTPTLSLNTVTLATSPQSAASFTVTVANVTRASDGETLAVPTATFTGRAPFNVASATSLSSTSLRVTFDAPPDAAQATMLGNYNVAGLTLSGAPALAGNTVTLTTSTQAAQSYAVGVTNVPRASDGEALTVSSASFTGRPPFNVAGAASANNVSITVTFDAAPDPVQATTLENYTVTNGLMVMGTPTLSGNTVTIQTASQSAIGYQVTVTNVTRASDGEPMTTTSAPFTGKVGFNVSSAASVNTTTMSVTFDAPPNAAQATTIGNYMVDNGLTLTGTPTLNGNTVTITTSAQSALTYTVTVNGVTRASDASPLQVTAAQFTHVSFNIVSAVATSNTSVLVTFDADPNAIQAGTAVNYAISGMGGLAVMAASVNANTVTLTTEPQNEGTTYDLTVMNVTRASDGTVLTDNTASFVGRASFDVDAVTTPDSGTLVVEFSHPPDPAAAGMLANYSVPGLTLIGTPVLSGNQVTISTRPQSAVQYTLTVSNVTRQSDGEALTTNSRTFTGKAVALPTVTNVSVVSTSPNNGLTFYNTGTATVVITGTELASVQCPSGVGLDDRNGANVFVGTQATSCTVDSNTQITATFPAGIRTNGGIGWNVIVTNTAGSNTDSSVKLKPAAGLVISEVYAGSAGGENEHEFIEIYNRTAQPISMAGVSVHVMNGTADTTLGINYTNSTIPAHGFVLLASSQSDAGDTWFAKRDGTYDASNNGTSMSGNSGVYISLSPAPHGKVLDKAGWGSAPTNSFEGAPITTLGNNQSAQRKPAGGQGATTDTDANASDFNAPSTAITPKGTADPIEP